MSTARQNLIQQLSLLPLQDDETRFEVISNAIIDLQNAPDDKNAPLFVSAQQQARILIRRNGQPNIDRRRSEVSETAPTVHHRGKKDS